MLSGFSTFNCIQFTTEKLLLRQMGIYTYRKKDKKTISLPAYDQHTQSCKGAQFSFQLVQEALIFAGGKCACCKCPSPLMRQLLQ
jgi:hypothetical protein